VWKNSAIRRVPIQRRLGIANQIINSSSFQSVYDRLEETGDIQRFIPDWLHGDGTSKALLGDETYRTKSDKGRIFEAEGLSSDRQEITLSSPFKYHQFRSYLRLAGADRTIIIAHGTTIPSLARSSMYPGRIIQQLEESYK
jgi:hypothetical protein